MKKLIALRSLIGNVLLVCMTFCIAPFVIFSGAMGLTLLADFFMRTWAKLVMFFYGVQVEVQGLENFPVNKGCLLLFNHQSLLDIPAIYAGLPRTIRFGAKTELFRIPIFGWCMAAVGTLPIARESRSTTMRTYQASERMFARGVSYALAPEGTRQSNTSLGGFKRGPFFFAIGAQAPIVPAFLEGAHAALPKKSLLPNRHAWRSRIRITVLPVIETLGLKPDDIVALSDRVRGAMLDAQLRSRFEG